MQMFRSYLNHILKINWPILTKVEIFAFPNFFFVSAVYNSDANNVFEFIKMKLILIFKINQYESNINSSFQNNFWMTVVQRSIC